MIATATVAALVTLTPNATSASSIRSEASDQPAVDTTPPDDTIPPDDTNDVLDSADDTVATAAPVAGLDVAALDVAAPDASGTSVVPVEEPVSATVLEAEQLAVPAQATTTFTVTGGTVDWGLKESFRTYIVGPIAHGTITPGGSVTVNGNGTFRFPVAGGQAQIDGPLQVRTNGSVQFDGHDGQLQMTMSNLRVETSGRTGTLYVDLTSVPLDGPSTPQSFPALALADLDLSGVPAAAATGGWVLTNVPAKVTAAGATAFGGFWTVGQPLDAVTITLAIAETGQLPQLGTAPPAATPTTINASGAGPAAAVPANALADTGGTADPNIVAIALLLVALGIAAVATRRAADRSFPAPARSR